mgnify:CR=1 FL=1
MNVLWIKDNNIGHEKQVKVLLDELSKNHNLNIDSRNIKGIFPMLKYIDKVQENFYDLIIGAGHKTYSFLINIKKNQKKSCKNIAILSPSIKKDKFDIICAPSHDLHKLKGLNNTIFYEGSLSKVSLKKVDQNILMIAIGGNNKHYQFNIDYLIEQINYFLSLHPDKNTYIFNSRRTPNQMNKKIYEIAKKNNNIVICDINKNDSISFESILHKASVKLITRDSVNMIYESLSSMGKTYLIDMKAKNNNSKVVNNVNKLITNMVVGHIESSDLVKGMSKMQLKKQNDYNEVFAEVEKLAYKINQLI